MACGGESKAAFEDREPIDQPRGEESSGAAGSGGAASDVIEPPAPLGGASGAATQPAGGEAAIGGGASGAAGSDAAGSGGAVVEGGSGGAAHGGGGSLSAGSGGLVSSAGKGAGSSAGSGGEPTSVEVPAACEPCRNNTQAFCDFSAIWPNGQCVGCPEFGPDANLYRDCDGPGAEHYVTKNDHDPGYGCETYVGYMGSCP